MHRRPLLNMDGYRFLHKPETEDINDRYTLTHTTRASGSHPDAVVAIGEGLELIFIVYDQKRNVSFLDRSAFPAGNGVERQYAFDSIKEKIRSGHFETERPMSGKVDISDLI